MSQFGERRIFYNNFAEHLLNRFNPNMTYPEKACRWSDSDWCGMMNMVADCGFNIFEFWLVPRLFCREALDSEYGKEFVRQIRVAADAAHKRGIKIEALCCLVTVGTDWKSYCPNCPEEWEEIRYLWKSWAERLDFVDIFSIFPGDPGCCSRNGCDAITYIDKSIEITHLIKSVRPNAEFDFNTWGPPFFGWGILKGPEGWQGEFLQDYQASAWEFHADRCRKSMEYLVNHAEDFAKPCSISINLGFNPDGIPRGDEDGRPWAKRLAEKVPVQTWDFSLTEGENGIFPHYRFKRLFEQRKKEQAVGCYSGGICYTMTPFLNSLSFYESAKSFMNPDADENRIAREFYNKVFGNGAEELVEDLILFEIVPEWGNHVKLEISREEYHKRMMRFTERAAAWKGKLNGSFKIYPSAEYHRAGLEFFGGIFRDLSADNPDFDSIAKRYWDHVYAIYDTLPEHVDPRPKMAVKRLIGFFRDWLTTGKPFFSDDSAILGAWVRQIMEE